MATTATLSRPAGRLRFTARLLLQDNPALAPGLLAVIAFLVFAGSEAGFYATVWYGGGLFLLALLAATAVAIGIPREVPRPVLVALSLLAAYTAWTFLSITWSVQKGAALDGANRTALYLVVLALFSLWPWNARGARLLLGTLGLGIALIGLVELLKANASENPLGYFIDVRFAQPAGYINANVALWTLGLFPCLFMASTRDVHPAARGGFLGGAGLLAGIALLGQSRGWALAVPVAVVLFVSIGPGRVRQLAAFVAVAGGTATVASPILAVHDDFSAGRMQSLLSHATSAILVMAGVLALGGAAWGLAERRLRLSEAQKRGVRRGTQVIVTAALCAAAVAFVVKFGDPVDHVSSSWKTFKKGEGQAEVGSSRFSTAGTNRYDFWRVAWGLFEDRPVRGVGVDNLQTFYLKRGRSGERPRFAHSLELGTLAQTGLVGALLLFGAFAAAFVGLVQALRKGYAPVAAAAGGAAAVFLYWLLHGSVDWFWEFPGLAGPAVAMLGLGAALAPRADPGLVRLPRPALAGGALAVLSLTAAFAAPWIAELDIDRASKGWTSDPDGALERLDRARALNPLSPKADLVAGTIALRLGRLNEADMRFRRAHAREPVDAYALLELGLIAAERDDRGRATAMLVRAVRLSPRDEIVRGTLRGVRNGRYVTTAQVNRLLLKRARGRVE